MTSRERFLKACRCEPVDHPPVWLMRQAGRYLPEYRELRSKFNFLTMCGRPDLAVEISLQPWRRFHMDAVIVFSDILLPAAAMGPKLRIEEGEGPRFEYAVRHQRDVDRLTIPHVRRVLAPTLEAIQELRWKLGDDTALLGFVGSPWTLAAYLVEGGGGDFSTLLSMREQEPKLMVTLLDKLTEVIVAYAREQARAGADAVQIFDTWGGLLAPQAYREFVVPRLKTIADAIREGGAVPILFIRQSESLFDEMLESGVRVVSIGPGSNLVTALARTKGRIAVQGNLDSEILTRPAHVVREATKRMLEETHHANGYIANLGHGVLQTTPVESVAAFVETVKGYHVG